jgi:hypothetical protein
MLKMTALKRQRLFTVHEAVSMLDGDESDDDVEVSEVSKQQKHVCCC